MNIPSVLLGAAIVLATLLCVALADRIRYGRRAPGAILARESAARRQSAPASDRAGKPRQPLKVVLSPEEAMAREVQLALETSGFSKAEAQAATRGVAATDRHSLENWVRAAFRKLNKAAA